MLVLLKLLFFMYTFISKGEKPQTPSCPQNQAATYKTQVKNILMSYEHAANLGWSYIRLCFFPFTQLSTSEGICYTVTFFFIVLGGLATALLQL